MNKQLKKTAVIAIIFAVMVVMIPANIAWAGRLWQTLPTRDLSGTPILIKTTASTEITATVANSTSVPTAPATSTATFLPGTHAAATPTQAAATPTQAAATPIQATKSATNPGSSTTSVLPTSTVIVTPGPTSSSIQTTASTQDPGQASATLPPGFVPTQSTQTANEFIPVINSDNPAVKAPNGESTLSIPLILVISIIILIIIGATLRIILKRNRKQE